MDDFQSAVESIFRRESGRIIATLIRISGSFDLAEEAMQDAFASALERWPTHGVRTMWSELRCLMIRLPTPKR